MSDTRRIGYGLNRSPADFFAARVDGVYLDTDRTDRSEREMLVRIGLRRGDTLVLIRMGDLGAGKGLRNLRAALEQRGVTIEVFEPEPDEPRPRGRPEKGGLDDHAWSRLEKLWRDPAVDGGYTITKACEAMREDPSDRKARERVRLRLHRKFGSKTDT